MLAGNTSSHAWAEGVKISIAEISVIIRALGELVPLAAAQISGLIRGSCIVLITLMVVTNNIAGCSMII